MMNKNLPQRAAAKSETAQHDHRTVQQILPLQYNLDTVTRSSQVRVLERGIA